MVILVVFFLLKYSFSMRDLCYFLDFCLSEGNWYTVGDSIRRLYFLRHSCLTSATAAVMDSSMAVLCCVCGANLSRLQCSTTSPQACVVCLLPSTPGLPCCLWIIGGSKDSIITHSCPAWRSNRVISCAENFQWEIRTGLWILLPSVMECLEKQWFI